MIVRTAALVAALSLCAQAQTVPVAVTKLLTDAREALGGEARLSAIRTFVIEGSIERGAPRAQNFGTFAIRCALPDRFVRTDSVLSVGPGTSVATDQVGFSLHRDTTSLGFNGRQVLYQPTFPERPRGPELRPATSAERLALLERAQQDFVYVTLGLFVASFDGAPAQFADAPGDANALLVALNGSTLRLSFDSRTRLPLRLGDLGYADYREVGGVKVPFRLVREPRTGGLVEVWRVKSIRHNVELNDRTFRR